MILLIKLLDSEVGFTITSPVIIKLLLKPSQSYTLRCAIIEVCGNLIIDLTKQDERSEDHKTQIDGFFDVLEERFIDINPYCRSRAIQVFTKLLEYELFFDTI